MADTHFCDTCDKTVPSNTVFGSYSGRIYHTGENGRSCGPVVEVPKEDDNDEA